MKTFKLIEKYFWAILILALIAGLLLPQYGAGLEFLMTPILMIILFMVFLKTDCLLILKQFRKPLFITYIITLFLIVLPSLIYLGTRWIDESLAIGLLLLAGTPAAVASPVLTDIVKGNRTLALAIVIPSYVVAPIVMPLLFVFWTGESITLDPFMMFKVLLLMIFIPLVASQTIKRAGGENLIEKTKKYYGPLNIILIAIIVFIAISPQADFIKENPTEVFTNLGWVYGLAIAMHIIGYAAGFWKKKEDRLALAVTKAYPNNALSIVLALQFFTPEIVIITVLSQFPWNTLPGPFKWVSKHLK